MTRVSFLVLASALAIAALGRAHPARAEPCPPAVALTGDDDAVAAVRAQLDARGIGPETARCPVVRARVEHRGAQLVVALARPPGAPAGVERAVGEPATAATVIESWVRSDVSAPLLEVRAIPPGESERPVPPVERGIQLIVAEETSVGSDRTVWQGMQLGACITLGAICVAARIHGGKVVASPSGWDRFSRKGAEAYIGIDVPIAVGRARVTPGFAAGYGTMLTHHLGDGDEKTGIEISGPRAAARVSMSFPITARLAIDVSTTAELTQATGVEPHGDPAASTITFPEGPSALFRLAVGVRYGAL